MNDNSLHIEDKIKPVATDLFELPESRAHLRIAGPLHRLLLAFAALLLVGFGCAATVVANDTLATLQALFDAMKVPL
jgi:hypothetical protein